MSLAHDYAKNNAERFRTELHEWLKIPSISTLPDHAVDVKHAAAWLKAKLEALNFDSVEVVETPGHPIVYAENLQAGEDAPTILVYGHYDVQPADEVEDGWSHPPFDPIEKNGKLYARGSSDDKGQVFIHVKAMESIITQDGKLPVNIKMVIEGEEEISSINLGDFLVKNKERLAADICVISDTAILSLKQPSIVYALRGLAYMELEVFGAKTDLHSGAFGGTVHNPAQALAEIIAQLHNPDGSISVPGFYDNVLALDEAERAELEKTTWTVEQWSESTGIDMPWGEEQYTLRERVGARPTLEVNGMVSGFYGEGAKTVLPAKALAKISCRLVANQDPNRIYELIRDYVAEITPDTIKSEVRLLHTGSPAYIDPNLPAMQAAIKAYKEVWGVEPLFQREGGSIPIVANFQQELDIPVILMGFGLNSDGAHGPDEHFHIELFHKGIDTIIHFLYEVQNLNI